MWRNQAARFGRQFILAMTGFIVRTRQFNLVRPVVNGILVRQDILAMLVVENT